MAGKRWKEEEIKRLKELIYLDRSYKDIGDILDRTPNSCSIQASRLKLTKPTTPWTSTDLEVLKDEVGKGTTHLNIATLLNRNEKAVGRMARQMGWSSINRVQPTTEEYRNKLPKDIVILEEYVTANTKVLHRHSCGYEWLVRPAHILHNGSGCPKCAGNLQKTPEQYRNELHKDYTALEDYTSGKTKILHRHTVCGHEWRVLPIDMLRGHGCPKCAKYCFDTHKPAVTYLIYFPSLEIYKVGVTGNLEKRMKQFGYEPEILLIRHFSAGKEAKELETRWLNTLEPFMHNTNKLKSGNTETFIC